VAVGRIDRTAGRVVDLRHVVLDRARDALPLPAEERAPELLRPAGVARGNLDVYRLPCHPRLLSSQGDAARRRAPTYRRTGWLRIDCGGRADGTPPDPPLPYPSCARIAPPG